MCVLVCLLVCSQLPSFASPRLPSIPRPHNPCPTPDSTPTLTPPPKCTSDLAPCTSTPPLPPSLWRRFHVNPKAERVEPVNMDTADILGDMYVTEKRREEKRRERD